MTYLMEEFEDTDESIWCKFIHYDPRSHSILLEDLKENGYSVVPRQKGLDLDHAILALNSLGRYHGMAKVLEQREIISKDDYKPYTLFTDLKLVKSYLYGSISNLSKVMKNSWGPEWEDTANKLKISFEPFAAKWMSMGTVQSETNFTVLNHGDFWSNNMMFKYDFQKRPIGVKFLDYQAPHYNTPCIDLSYFMYLGIQPPVRRSNYQFLLKTYHDSLVRTLDKFGFTGTKPTLEDITDTMKRLEFFGLTYFAVSYPNLTCTSSEALDFEKVIATGGKEGFNEDVLKKPEMIEKLGPDIIDFVERHVSGLNQS
ncbi:unnamed protein product [Nezara viridula]|uniref:CHK kinase-like domain-containing protein n=1 Tax=Nezara viridula TaxID=85310 RepID=A0A9P0HSV7_NEZVI|nr:unnamed protein product [Nezara viridula]